MEYCLHISKTICMKNFVCVFPKLFLKPLLSFNILILKKLLPYHCIKKRYERIFVKILNLGGWGCKGVAAPKLGRTPFHAGKISERTIGKSGREFTERLQFPKFYTLLRPWLRYCKRPCIQIGFDLTCAKVSVLSKN